MYCGLGFVYRPDQTQGADESEGSAVPREECACMREERGGATMRGAVARHNVVCVLCGGERCGEDR
eukprot:382177-Pleurochrysis_carterae.AAC.1